MSQTRLSPMQEILRAIEHVAPNPWHYRAEAEREGYNLEGVEQVLEMLHLEGLVARGPSVPPLGPGVVLTPKGERVAGDPDLFARLGTGEALDAADPGALVRQSLSQTRTPVLNRLLLLANFLVFAWCIYLANNAGKLGAYLQGSLVNSVWHRAGSVSPGDLVRGEWWRLLTCCFVHGGLLHIAMNMYALYSGGQFVEQTWGRWRYAIIYAISCWGGSCLAMAMTPGNMVLVGASGAVCGVFVAIGVWFFLNGKHMPRGMARRGRSQIVTNVLLVTFISLIPGVSGYAHLGGAAAGGLAAVALNFARFGAMPVRLLAWPVLLAIPIASWLHLEHARKTSPIWRQIEAHAPKLEENAESRAFGADHGESIQETMKSAIADYDSAVKDVRDTHPDRRDEADTRNAIAALDAHIAALDRLADELQRSGPYRSAKAAGMRDDALSYVRQSADVFREAKRCLEAGKAWTRAEERAFDEKWKEMERSRKKWEARLR